MPGGKSPPPIQVLMLKWQMCNSIIAPELNRFPGGKVEGVMAEGL